MEEEMTLPKRMRELVAQHGSLRKVAAVLDIDVGYLSKLGSGAMNRPSDAVLSKLGLRATVTYHLTTGE